MAVPPSGARQALRDEPWSIYIDGEIESGTESRLATLIRQHRISRASVYLNSPGGSLLAGMAIGRLLREKKFATHVGRRNASGHEPLPGVCYSACPFAFAGGTRRTLVEGSALGLHRARNRVPVPDDSAFERRVTIDAMRYVVEMGVSPELVTLMGEAPHEGIRLLSAEESLRLRIVTP